MVTHNASETDSHYACRKVATSPNGWESSCERTAWKQTPAQEPENETLTHKPAPTVLLVCMKYASLALQTDLFCRSSSDMGRTKYVPPRQVSCHAQGRTAQAQLHWCPGLHQRTTGYSGEISSKSTGSPLAAMAPTTQGCRCQQTSYKTGFSPPCDSVLASSERPAYTYASSGRGSKHAHASCREPQRESLMHGAHWQGRDKCLRPGMNRK